MDGVSDATTTELIAINYAKRQLGILPDEWYRLDLDAMERGRHDLIPNIEQINEAARIIENS